MPIYSLGFSHPVLPPIWDHWIAPTAAVIGDVSLGENASIWWNAVVRGDNDRIAIGARTNIQDGAVLHADKGSPLTLGDDVSVGHLATVHGCTIGANVLIGMGAIVLNGALIGDNCLIGAGALVTEGKIIPPGSLVLGRPGKVARDLTEEEIARQLKTVEGYVQRWRRYRDVLLALS